MKTKISNLLSEKARDMGLSWKAIGQLAELVGKGLPEDASDEDIEEAVEALMPVAKIVQSEVTRKKGAKPSVKKPSVKEIDESNEGSQKDDDEQPAWAKKLAESFQSQLDELKAENAALKAEKAKSERNAQIAAKAKELGIPDYLMKRVAIAEGADIDKELVELKQDLVNNNLMPKGQASESATTLEELAAQADEWVKTLPKV